MALKLPVSIIGRQDLHRLTREVEALDNYIRQSRIRGQKLTMPRMTASLERIVADNAYDVLDDKVRAQLLADVQLLLKDAPSIHISFALEPPAAMVQKIVSWFREQVHPAVMLQVGIQPTIAAGCVLRTPNKYFDFSLRQHLRNNQGKLSESIRTHSEAALREAEEEARKLAEATARGEAT